MQSKKGDPVDTHEIAVSNMIGIEALVGLLVTKGIFTTEEILAEVKEVRDDMVRKARRPPRAHGR